MIKWIELGFDDEEADEEYSDEEWEVLYEKKD